MKTTLLTFLSSIAIALSVLGQISPTPSAQPGASATASATNVAASPTVAASPSATVEDEDAIERTVSRKLKQRFGAHTGSHHGIVIGNDHHGDDSDFDSGALMAIPIVGIIFTTLFGAPVLVVAAIMFFSYLKARSLHRTVRTMVEKGQEVPAALFVTPPSAVRARSDLRRGVVLMMVGFGLVIFFGAVNDWEGGAWSMGMIPFLIGLGYLLVWKLEGRKDKVPPLS